MKFKPSSNAYYDIAGDEEVDDDLNHVVVTGQRWKEDDFAGLVDTQMIQYIYSGYNDTLPTNHQSSPHQSVCYTPWIVSTYCKLALSHHFVSFRISFSLLS